MTDRERDLHALRNLIDEAHLTLDTADRPDGRTQRARELLSSALSLADALLEAPAPTAAALGKKGGLKTAQRGSDYFRELAKKRKTKAGGRPRKSDNAD